MTDSPEPDHWPRHARQWALVGPPLRPSPADVAVVAGVVAGSCAAGARVLVLGVTPELVEMRWPPSTEVVAIDRARAVIGSIFPAGAARATAIQGDWLALPCADASLTAVVGDGSLSNLRFPDAYRAIAGELARVLAPGGVVVLRLFAAPEAREPLAGVREELHASRISNINVLKWRLAMAVQPGDRNVPVVEILRAFDEIVRDRAELAARPGWSRAHVDSVDVYRGSPITYSFPTVREVEAALAPALEVIAMHTPRYELGDRCPTLVLRAH
jgi:SAM-dependent methyltransferase